MVERTTAISRIHFWSYLVGTLCRKLTAWMHTVTLLLCSYLQGGDFTQWCCLLMLLIMLIICPFVCLCTCRAMAWMAQQNIMLAAVSGRNAAAIGFVPRENLQPLPVNFMPAVGLTRGRHKCATTCLFNISWYMTDNLLIVSSLKNRLTWLIRRRWRSWLTTVLSTSSTTSIGTRFDVILVSAAIVEELPRPSGAGNEPGALWFCSSPPYLHLATSEMWCWSGWRRIFTELSLCYSIMCYCNGEQWYKQFLQVGRLQQALILLGLALCLPSTSVSSVFMMLCIFTISVTLFTIPNSELNLLGLTNHCASVRWPVKSSPKLLIMCKVRH